jgi:hypothetical protein
MEAWGVWQHVFSIRCATMGIPAMGYGLRYEYGIFKQSFKNGWQRSFRIRGYDGRIRGRIPRPEEAVEVHLNTSYEIRNGELITVPGVRSISSVYLMTVQRLAMAPTISTRCVLGASTPDAL